MHNKYQTNEPCHLKQIEKKFEQIIRKKYENIYDYAQ